MSPKVRIFKSYVKKLDFKIVKILRFQLIQNIEIHNYQTSFSPNYVEHKTILFTENLVAKHELKGSFVWSCANSNPQRRSFVSHRKLRPIPHGKKFLVN